MCKWGGKTIKTSQELAHAFDQQVINDVAGKLHVQRKWWETNAKVSEQPLPPRVFTEKRVYHKSLKAISFNITTAWKGRLEPLFDQYAEADIICVQGTAIHKKWAPAQGPREDLESTRTHQCEKNICQPAAISG